MSATAQPLSIRLSALLEGIAAVAPVQERAVAGLTLDSREVLTGGVFAALKGSREHGLRHVGAALARGAAAVLYEPAPELELAVAEQACADAGAPLVAVPGLSRQLSAIAGRFYGEPSATLRLVGVTGTDGKTSTSQFIAQALAAPGTPCGVVGTLGYGLLGQLAPASHTTPDAVRVQQLLAAIREAGAAHVAMEVSSHALDQGRVAALRFDVVVLTNLTRDHLDYHGTVEAYADAKAALFAQPGLKSAVLNLDDAFGERLLAELPAGVAAWTYSLDGRADAKIRCTGLRFAAGGLQLAVATSLGAAEFEVPLLGRFNGANVLAALGALLALGLALPEAIDRLRTIEPVAGRMQRLGGGALPTVIVDYAHTPGGLAAALDAVRAHTAGRVWCVFGCGGDRDRGKRPKMAALAEAGADEIIVTDDNPRSEDPERIVAEILAGLTQGKARVVRDRAEAIRRAVAGAGAGDAVLIAGKGHENYQLVGERRLPFDDCEAARAALQERAECC